MGPERKQGDNMQHKGIPYITMLIIWLLFSYSIMFLYDTETIILLAKEDGFFETTTAIWFLIAVICFFYLFFKDRLGNNLYMLKTNKNIFFLLLGILFLFSVGEEISWGQRILNIQVPDVIKKLNMQGEINIHNLPIFHGTDASGERKTGFTLITTGRLSSVFWFSYCFIIPIMNKMSSTISKRLKTVNLPIVPIWIGVLFVLNYIISRVVDLIILGNMHRYNHYVEEIKESNIALLFLVIAVLFIKNYRSKTKQHILNMGTK